MLTRRSFVRSVGLGAAGALTGSFIAARGREHSIWSAMEPEITLGICRAIQRVHAHAR